MLTLLEVDAHATLATLATLPLLSAEHACIGLHQQPAEIYEAILARAEANSLKHVPGSFFLNAAEPCRTWICDCTRAVPHGSFL